jgi:hypothetical protein
MEKLCETHRESHTNGKLVAKHNISEERYNGYENGSAIPKGVKKDRI